MSTHNIGFAEAILMSTHNIGFYEDLTKIIFELSSNTHLISSAVSSVCLFLDAMWFCIEVLCALYCLYGIKHVDVLNIYTIKVKNKCFCKMTILKHLMGR